MKIRIPSHWSTSFHKQTEAKPPNEKEYTGNLNHRLFGGVRYRSTYFFVMDCPADDTHTERETWQIGLSQEFMTTTKVRLLKCGPFNLNIPTEAPYISLQKRWFAYNF